MKNFKPFHLCFEVQSDFRYLPFLSRIFKGLKTPAAPRLTQALVEAYNNAVIHAHKRRREKWIAIDIFLSKGHKRIRLADEGKGFKKRVRNQESKLWKTSGRGLQIIAAHAHRSTSRKKGKHHILEIVF